MAQTQYPFFRMKGRAVRVPRIGHERDDAPSVHHGHAATELSREDLSRRASGTPNRIPNSPYSFSSRRFVVFIDLASSSQRETSLEHRGSFKTLDRLFRIGAILSDYAFPAVDMDVLRHLFKSLVHIVITAVPTFLDGHHHGIEEGCFPMTLPEKIVGPYDHFREEIAASHLACQASPVGVPSGPAASHAHLIENQVNGTDGLASKRAATGPVIRLIAQKMGRTCVDSSKAHFSQPEVIPVFIIVHLRGASACKSWQRNKEVFVCHLRPFSSSSFDDIRFHSSQAPEHACGDAAP